LRREVAVLEQDPVSADGGGEDDGLCLLSLALAEGEDVEAIPSADL